MTLRRESGWLEIKRKPWQTRWCFRCRARLPQTAILIRADADPPDDWYGPHWIVECEGCGEDHVRFPGTEDGPMLELVYD